MHYKLQQLNIKLRNIVVCFVIGCLIIPTAVAEITLRQQTIHKTITEAVKAINTGNNGAYSPVIPKRRGLYPIICGDAETYTANPLHLQGSCPPILLAGWFGRGKIIAAGHDGWLLESSEAVQETKLAANCLRWLVGSSQNPCIAFYTSIGSLVSIKTVSSNIKKEFSEQGITFIDLSEKVSSESLSGCSVLVIARPHLRSMSEDEAVIISQFVKDGGSLFIAGLGWFWLRNNPDSLISDFPLNTLGRHIGIEYSEDIIYKQDREGRRRHAAFQVDSPVVWRPKRTKVFNPAETTDQSILMSVRKYKDTHNFAFEGEHVILSLPGEAFLQLHSPIKAVKDLDTVYKTHKRLADNVPYSGRKISIVVVNRLCFHLCSGNPILIRKDRIPVVLNDFNELGHAGWGLIHELGHDFVASGHKHIYPLGPGDNECWTNMFTLHAFETLDLKEVQSDTHDANIRKGLSYYYANKADYDLLKNDRWTMLSLLKIIKDTYGWDCYYSFFKVCVQKAKTNKIPGTEQEKVDFIVEELSKAAQADLGNYFVRWGFPVSASVLQELQNLPPADLDQAAKAMALKYSVPIKD